jgi:hypothetical protein
MYVPQVRSNSKGYSTGTLLSSPQCGSVLWPILNSSLAYCDALSLPRHMHERRGRGIRERPPGTWIITTIRHWPAIYPRLCRCRNCASSVARMAYLSTAGRNRSSYQGQLVPAGLILHASDSRASSKVPLAARRTITICRQLMPTGTSLGP